MLRTLLDTDLAVEDIERDARRLHRHYFEKNDLPRIAGVNRALTPDWCDVCSERCWGPVGGGFAICDKCRGQGKTPLGFSFT